MELTESELWSLVTKGASSSIHLHQDLPLDDDTVRTLCAFANTSGGYYLVGVGAKTPPPAKETQAELRRLGADLISPPVDVQTTVTPHQDQLVVVAHVASSDRKPHSPLIAGERPEPLVRVGAGNHVATGPTLGALGIGHRAAKPKDPLERRILEWMGNRGRTAKMQKVQVTTDVICDSLNLGGQRVKRALVNLERDGYVVAYGYGKKRVFDLP